MLLPLIGAGLGGFEAYQRSGGDIGAAALGAGLGAVGGRYLPALAPTVTRFAGQALAPFQGSALSATSALGKIPGLGQLTKGMSLAQQAALGSKLTGVAKLATPGTLAALGTGAGIVGGLALPALAGGVANIASAPVRALTGGVGTAAQTGAGALGYRTPAEAAYGGDYIPPGMGQYGPTGPIGDPLDVLGLPGMGRRLEQLKAAETQRDAMRLLLPEVYKASEARSKSEFARQMAAAGIRQNIATRAAMLQAAQQAGLNMGATAAQQAGGALTSQYQYS